MLRSQRKPMLPPPSADKEYVVTILPEVCDGCELCVEFCPTEVLKIDMEEFNSRMLHPVVAVKPDECVGCQQCERLCPSVSIFVTEIQLLQEDQS